MNKAYEIVTNKILELMEKGIIPWHKPWRLTAGMLPQNAISHKAYRGINPILLGLAGYSDPRWLTYNQAVSKGGYIRGGEEAMPITYSSVIEKETDELDDEGNTVIKKFWFLRYYSVFNVEQTADIEWESIDRDDRVFNPIAAADAIVTGMPNAPSITHNGNNRAFYKPATDSIHLPPMESFDDVNEYYSTTFHEMSHATGHESRLNRAGINDFDHFGSEQYGFEELVSEFSAAFLCNEAGIVNGTMTNSAGYIQSWANKFKNDPSLIVKAASFGNRASDYILTSA